MFIGLRKKKPKTNKVISNPTKCNAASAGPSKQQQDRMIDMMLEAFQERDDATTREILRKLVQLSGGTMDWSFRKDKSSQVSMLVSKKLSYFEVLDLTIWKAPPPARKEEARIRELDVPPFEQLMLAVRENDIDRVTQLMIEEAGIFSSPLPSSDVSSTSSPWCRSSDASTPLPSRRVGRGRRRAGLICVLN